MKVYLASPLGFSTPTRDYYVMTLVPAVEAHGIEVLDPWDASADVFAAAQTDEQLREANALCGATNEALIRGADAVFAVLDGVDVDSGTAAEIGFAAALGIPVVGWRSDFRSAGDNGQSVVNLQVEHWLTGPVHSDLETALRALSDLR